MSITTVTPENADQYGRFTIASRAIGPEGTISIHRRQIAPGTWEDGAWVPTDVSGEDAVVKAFANSLWTTQVVAAFKAAFPPEPDEA